MLIIDEVSMVSGEMFEELEHQARQVMHSEEPFGGIQLVLSGDFFQCANLFGLSKLMVLVAAINCTT